MSQKKSTKKGSTKGKAEGSREGEKGTLMPEQLQQIEAEAEWEPPG